MKNLIKKKWFWVVLAILFIGGLINSITDGTNKYSYESTTATTEQMTTTETTETSTTPIDDTDYKNGIKNAVNQLIADDYKKDGFHLDILTLVDGGYSVSAQVPLEKEPPESTAYIKGLIESIKNLDYDDINEIHIKTLKNMVIVDEFWWPLDDN